MTRAGEKLYGDWDRVPRREGLFSSRRFWFGFIVTIIVLAIAATIVGHG